MSKSKIAEQYTNSCRCDRMLKSTSYVVNGGTFYIITNGTNLTLHNRMTFSLVLCQNIPVQTEILPVSIQVNGTNYPLLDRYGNRVMITDLHTRCRYSLVYGSESPHFLAFNICSNLNNVNLTIETEVVDIDTNTEINTLNRSSKCVSSCNKALNTNSTTEQDTVSK